MDARGGENSKNAPSSGDWRPTLVDRVHHLVAMVAWRTLFVLEGAMQIEIACLMHRTRKHIIPAHYQAALDCLAALIGRAQVVEVELSQVRFSPPHQLAPCALEVPVYATYTCSGYIIAFRAYYTI